MAIKGHLEHAVMGPPSTGTPYFFPHFNLTFIKHFVSQRLQAFLQDTTQYAD
jgi:hypothetical protein